MVSCWLDSRASAPGSSPGLGHCTGEFNAGGNPVMDWHPIQGGVEIVLVASC